MAVSAARSARRRRHVESRHIDHIPDGAGHGTPWHQFAFWFGTTRHDRQIAAAAYDAERAA